jgi:hypothetical protein
MSAKSNPKNDHRLKKEFGDHDYMCLIYSLNLLNLTIKDHSVELSVQKSSNDYYEQLKNYYKQGGTFNFNEISGAIKLNSAYSSIQSGFKAAQKDYWRHFENDFTC